MIQRNNSLTVLPFYDNLDQQHQYKPYAFGAIYPLFASAKLLIPFQFKIQHIDDFALLEQDKFIERISLVDARTKSSISIYDAISQYIQRYTEQDIDYIVYTADTALSKNLAEGQYYLYIKFVDGQEAYSEVITIVNDIDRYLKISWWDEEDLTFDSGKIIYENPSFRNILYLDTDIGKPEYKFEEDGKERDGYFFAEKQLSEKVYKFVFIAPEYVCDAIRFIRLSDNIVISKSHDTYNVDSFLAEVNWQDQGDLANVDVEFRTGTVVKKIAAAWPK